MDPKYTGEMLKHLEKQDELLMDAYRSMSHELHKLQIISGPDSRRKTDVVFLKRSRFMVEEEMLMRKFYELMSAQGLTKKNDGGNDAQGDGVIDPGKALVNVTPNE